MTPAKEADSSLATEEMESITTPSPSADDKDVSANQDELLSTTPASPPPSQPVATPTLPTPKPRAAPTSNIFTTNKRKPANTTIVARAPQAIQTEFGKASSVNLISAEDALSAQQVSGAAEKKSKKGNAAAFFAAKSAAEKPKGRLRRNDDGDLIIKPKALGLVSGEKRKRGDVVEVEGANKRRAGEGRTFKPLRVRSAVLGADAMEVDSVGGGLGAGVAFGM